MPRERSSSWASEFSPNLVGVPARQGRAKIPEDSVAALRATPFQVLGSEEVPPGTCCIPFRAVLYKPAGDAYTVPNGTHLRLQWLGISQDLLHIEVDPAILGANEALDQSGEATLVASGPSFDWTGASEILQPLGASVDAEGKGLQLVNVHATTEISSVGVPLYLWVWYYALPIRA